MNNSAKHERINDILLGPLERPALLWLAAHSPAWMTPDLYTLIGVLGAVVILVGYLLSILHPAFFWLASFGFLLNWYGDSLDGTLARYRHIERPIFGFYLDHITDAACQVLIFIGLGLSPYVSFDVAVLTLAAYLLLSVLAYVRTITVSQFQLSYGKLGPTEARLLAVILNIAMFFFGERIFTFETAFLTRLGLNSRWTLNPYDLYVGAIGGLLLYFFLTTAIQEGLRLAKENK